MAQAHSHSVTDTLADDANDDDGFKLVKDELVKAVRDSGVAKHDVSNVGIKASLCIMVAINECIVLKAFFVSMAKLDKHIEIPSKGDNMCYGNGNGRHCLQSTHAGSLKQRFCDFIMYLFHEAFSCGHKEGTYPIKVFGVDLCSVTTTTKNALMFTDVEVRSQPPMPPPLPPPLPDACLLHPVYAAQAGHRGR